MNFFVAVFSLLPDFIKKIFMSNHIVLYAHVISNNSDCLPAQRYRYPTDEEFISFRSKFESMGYTFVGLNDYLNKRYPKMILLTFDDGFKEVYTFHKKFTIPMLIFIPTDIFKEKFSLGVFNYVEGSFLTRNDILILKAQGVDVGYHTKSHKKITSVEDLVGESEIEDNHQELFSEPLCFAYPFMAPDNYQLCNEKLQAVGFEYFFDTKAKFDRVGNHIYRVSTDVAKHTKVANPILHNIYRATLSRIYGSLEQL